MTFYYQDGICEISLDVKKEAKIASPLQKLLFIKHSSGPTYPFSPT